MNELVRLQNCRPIAVQSRPPLNSRLHIIGYLSSGTYGRVYKASVKRNTTIVSSPALVGTPGQQQQQQRPIDSTEDEGQLCAIKKFKPDKEGEAITYTGISQSACREIMVCFNI